MEEDTGKGQLSKEEIEAAEAYLDPEGTERARLATVSKKSAQREVKKVIELSDVVVHVLDARDPEGTRSADVEE